MGSTCWKNADCTSIINFIIKDSFQLNDTKFTNWATGQPNKTVGDNYRCVVDEADIGWTVSDCSIAQVYACEKPGSKSLCQ